jgi:8-oxo-dGTP pyrophosphatase MutT (NUDIX family)
MATQTTLCYVIKYGKILLAKKKKGFGAGKWNGAGGKIEANETAQDAAAREMFEEVNIVPENPKKIGTLEFYFGQGNEVDIVAHVFIADEYDGIEKETNEAVPKWFPIGRIPYDEMWPDDKVWMPLMLQGKKFIGRFYFDKDLENIIRYEINEVQGVIA